MKTIVYKLQLRLRSPLAIGAGEGVVTDRDLLLDGQGRPFLPASSLAGLYRSRMKDRAEALFGSLESCGRVMVYDGCLQGEAVVAARDRVKLDRHKTAEPGAKMNFQVVEPGAVFHTFLELNVREEGDEQAVDGLVRGLRFFSLGGMITRGYGRVETTAAYRRAFDRGSREGARDWLAFDLFAPDAFGEADRMPLEERRGGERRLAIQLQPCGGPMIRRRSTAVGEADFQPLSLADGCPVVPGSSWAGAFRRHMRALAEELGLPDAGKRLDAVFGFATPQGRQRSRIAFSESRIEGSERKQRTRVAIDRFTGGSHPGSLFTEQACYGGKTVLEIAYADMEPCLEALLLVALLDLHHGILSVGGQTAVGHGLFALRRVLRDGEDITEDLLEGRIEKLVPGGLEHGRQAV